MRDVVNRLHANVCYLIMDDLREEELYTQAPVKVSFPEEEDHLDFSLTVETRTESKSGCPISRQTPQV